MNALSLAWSQRGLTIVAAVLILTACGGNAAAPTATPTATPLPPTATPVPPTPTPVPPTPTPLAPALSVSTAAAASAPTPTAPPSDPRAQALISSTHARFEQVNRMHFALTTEGDVYLDQTRTEKLKSGDGDLVRPDRVSLTARAAVGPVNAQIKFIQIGDTAYITNIISGKWETAPSGFGYDPRLVFDQDRGVAALLANVSGWSLVGTEKVNGTDTQHVHAPVPTSTINDLVNASLRGDVVDVDLFIEPKNSDVLRMVLAERPDAVTAGTVAARWVLDLSKQNDSGIKVEAPPLGS